MIRALVTAIAALTLTTPALAGHHEEGEAEMAHIGPMTGFDASGFTALTPTGEAITLADISGENGAVLVFSRSLDWCPFCQKQSIDLIEATEPLAELGWDLNLITYDSPGILAAYASEKGIPYQLLSDTDSAMIDAFHLRNTDVPAGSRYDGIPHPAIIFISPEGEVKAMLREEGYRDRPPVPLVLETATDLNGEAG